VYASQSTKSIERRKNKGAKKKEEKEKGTWWLHLRFFFFFFSFRFFSLSYMYVRYISSELSFYFHLLFWLPINEKTYMT